MGLLSIVFAVVLLGCPTAAPEAKKKGGDSGGDEDEKPYVCPKAQPITETPVDKNALQRLVEAAITTENPSPDLNHIDTSKVVAMNNIFSGKNNFNGDVSCWDTSNVTTMGGMFFQATVFNQDLSGWNVGLVTVHANFATGAGFATDTAKHPKWK